MGASGSCAGVAPSAGARHARAEHKSRATHCRTRRLLPRSDGKPFYSRGTRKRRGRPRRIAVRASEDVRIEEADPAAKTAESAKTRNILYYRNPMGLPDTSPTQKRIPWGWIITRIWKARTRTARPSKIAPGKIQRAASKRKAVTTRILMRPVRAPTSIQLDERRVSVVALRFDAYLENALR